jgi:hypothetical protein
MLRIRGQLEAMLCPSWVHAPGCPCEKLRSLYGRSLFKCDRFRCEYYRVGFDTRSDRDSHLRIHNRPFKCAEPNCEFADLGFISERDLVRHRSKIHQCYYSVVNTAFEMPADRFKPEDLESILKDAIEADEVDFVRSHYPRSDGFPERQYTSFLHAAAQTASPPMVDCLLEYASLYPDATVMKERALRPAIKGENIAVIKHLIARGANPTNADFLGLALATYNVEIIEIFLGHGAHLVEYPGIFDKIWWDARKEDDVFKVLHRMHKYVVGKEAFSRGCRNASLRGSIPLVKYFIDNGADIDYKISNDSILYELVLGYLRRNAEVIRFLLQEGANPYSSNSKGLSIKSLAGMRKVEKYFNKSWDDLVREVQAERASMTDEE